MGTVKTQFLPVYQAVCR